MGKYQRLLNKHLRATDEASKTEANLRVKIETLEGEKKALSQKLQNSMIHTKVRQNRERRRLYSLLAAIVVEIVLLSLLGFVIIYSLTTVVNTDGKWDWPVAAAGGGMVTAISTAIFKIGRRLLLPENDDVN